MTDQPVPAAVTIDGTPAIASWRTLDFKPQRAGTAALFVDDEHRMTIPIAGWLIQEERFHDEAGVHRATGQRQVVPGYFSPSGTVIPLADLKFNVDGSTETVSIAVRLNADTPDTPPVVNVEIVGPVDVAPKTKTVIRDDQGRITHVLEGAQ